MGFRSANPALNEKTFADYMETSSNRMTLQGTVNRTGVLLVVLTVTACWVWNIFQQLSGNPAAAISAVMPWMLGGLIAGLILCLITVFKKTWAPVTAVLYAAAEGLFVGGISAIMEAQYPGIVAPAVGLTFGTLGALLLAYKSGFIRATENFKLGVVSAICLVYLVSIVLRLFGINMPYIHGAGPIGIGFSIFVVIIAALNLVLDFDFIEEGVKKGAPKYLEWYGAFALMVTLIWLYIEILRLLSKLRSRN
jgi:uncharacterized YccA/Bax inhibitor family protein